MSVRLRWLLVIGVSIVALGATALVGWFAWQQFQARQNAPSSAETTTDHGWAAQDRLVFRNTAAGQGYGHVASVALDDPTGPRAVTDVACDRVDAVDDEFVCLRTERGIAPTFVASLYANDATQVGTWPLPGIPSRTRISADGELIATTAFVTGHSYATIGFSTETMIRTRDGESFGSLEEFVFIREGVESAPTDRNFWGVTFIDDTTFYATAGMTLEGKTYLIKGDLAARTLTTIADDVECPSLSPDGKRIAFKKVTAGSGPTVHWTPAIMDLKTGDVRLLPETRNVDDQIEWLDDETILYGMPRDDAPGDTDVWALDVDGAASPKVFVEHAWSPSVVRN
ncbi:hypothetical protein [Microbacterium sp.]|uniref:TolB family protein n=1 Tax=Microbacterium sp. TaxID=51671 RepID=UPI003221BDA1